ncbi:CDP-diacylglycerol--serine O-phosphatidyltransferase [Methyloceanibacter sp.]|uniref:CDP-diacylglycerol--serine O-phosphatidyltransferase n=1 Tax=Methyloceanibacter sp. TaxID=1965321 RepID=UPI002D656807|nr:CDP-diacylglycerol--serine O-phosphatidyltransferase [Methyloceanibacter sp.]HZP09892.1 CDP-diacylglycerol--serine O-phosphatidyltransferase [Methyloceanibacter sp.]
MFPPFEPERDERKRRQIAFARGQVPVRVLIPNIFTLVGLCAGLTAIRMGIESRWDLAVAALVFAALLDGIDGRIARLLKASSRFGAELDSLADFVNFGVAPAIIMYNWALEDLHSLGWIAVLVFAVCSALRLARFNVALDQTNVPAWKSNYFVGVPAPAGAITLLLPIYAQNLGLHLPSLTPLVFFYTLTIALLMVSKVPTFSGKLIGQKIPREYVPPVFVAAALFMAMLVTYPYLTLTVGSLLYLAVIPLSAYRYFAQERKVEAMAKGQPAKGSEREHDAGESGKVVEMGAKSRSTGKGLSAKP